MKFRILRVILEGGFCLVCFSFCDSLKSIPEGLALLSEGIFYKSGVTSAKIPEGVTSVPNYAFYNCRNLASAEFPVGLVSIGNDAFSFTALTSVVLPEGLTKIEGAVFEGCSSLTAVTLPSTIDTISLYAFRDCPNITSITSYATRVPVCSPDAFYGWEKDSTTVYVLKGMVDAYKATDGWNDFTNFQEMEIIGIRAVDAAGAVEVARYTSDGQRLAAPQRGINIVRMSDGTVKKVIVK